MSVDRLFSALMQVERTSLAIQIARNIGGGGEAGAASGTVPAGGTPPADVADAGTPPPGPSRLPAGLGAPNPLRQHPAASASHSLVGLRPATDPANAVMTASAAPSSPYAAGPQSQAAPLQSQIGLSNVAGQAADAASPSGNASSAPGSGSAETSAPGASASGANGSEQGAAATSRGRDQADASGRSASMSGNGASVTNSDSSQPAVRREQAAGASQEPARDAAAGRTSPEAPVNAGVRERTMVGLEGWALPLLGAGNTERAGIITSVILNAAMIPGWPAPKPIELAAQRALVPDRLGKGLAPANEGEVMTYLANMGANKSLLSKIRDLTRPLVRQLQILIGLAVMLTLMTVTIRSLDQELAAIEEERRDLEENAERRRRNLAD
jgi:hypothetical protein